MGGAELEKADVTYFRAPIRVEQNLNETVMTVAGLFDYVAVLVKWIS